MNFILVCLFFLLGLFILFNTFLKNGFRESAIKTFIVYSYFVLVCNEVLSLFNSIVPQIILNIYLVFIFFIWSYILYSSNNLKGFKNLINSIKNIRYFFSLVQLIIVIIILLILLFLAIYIAPNNVDAMGYHIPRVILWAQNHNLSHFPTEFLGQLFYNVQMEYFFLHAFLITGDDLFFNLIQWCTLILTLITTSKILNLWSLNQRIQGLGVIMTLTMPLAILTSTSSKNDLLSGCYLLIAIYFGFKVLVKNFSWIDIFYCLSAIVFAGFTKYSVWLLAFPLSISFGIYFLRENCLKSFKILGVFILIFLFIFLGFFYRNFILFGQLVRPVTNSKIAVPSYSNEYLGWETIVSNLIKMMGNHVSLPWDLWNRTFDDFVFMVHDWMHFSPNNFFTAWSSYVTNFAINEDFSGNFFHFFLIILSIGICLINKKLRKSIQLQYFFFLFLGLIIYALLIKWNTFNSRTQFPYFIALSPFITFVFAKTNLKFLKIVSIILIFQSIPYIFLNANKKILPLYYWYKKEISHLPKVIYYDPSMQSLFKLLNKRKIYFKKSDIKGFEVLMLNGDLSKSEKKYAFSILDSFNVFRMDKVTIFSNSNRFSHYIGYFPDKENIYISIIKKIGRKRKKVGIASFSSHISPFFILGRYYNGPDFEIKYIRFSSFFKNQIHPSNNYFNYDAIISDNQSFINNLNLPHSKIIKVKDWYLILLGKPSNKTYYSD